MTESQEISALAGDNTVRYSICTLVTNHDEYRTMVKSFTARGFQSPVCEFIHIDNTQGNKHDAYSGLNALLRVARGQYVIFCHQDIELIDDDMAALDARIEEISRIDKNWAVLGNAGGVRPGQLAIRITDMDGSDVRRGSFPARVRSLDENFLLLRADANLGLSRDLSGFHFYGTDLCIIAQTLGYSAYVIDFNLWHKGGHSQQSSLEDIGFYKSQQAFIDKYRRAFSFRCLQTTCARFCLSGSHVLNRVTNCRIMCPLMKRLYAGRGRVLWHDR